MNYKIIEELEMAEAAIIEAEELAAAAAAAELAAAAQAADCGIGGGGGGASALGDFKKKRRVEAVQNGDVPDVDPLQLARAYAILANGGYKIKPTILKREKKSVEKRKQIISNITSNAINLIL